MYISFAFDIQCSDYTILSKLRLRSIIAIRVDKMKVSFHEQNDHDTCYHAFALDVLMLRSHAQNVRLRIADSAFVSDCTSPLDFLTSGHHVILAAIHAKHLV